MPSLPASVLTRIWKSRRANASRVPSRVWWLSRAAVAAGRVPGVQELLDEPVGGVGVLGEHDRLLAVPGLHAVTPEARQLERVPLADRQVHVRDERQQALAERVDLPTFGLRGLAALMDDPGLVGLRAVVAVRVGVVRGCGRHHRSHAVPAALEGLREGVQAGCGALAVHHLPQRHADPGEVPVDQVQGLVVELGLDR